MGATQWLVPLARAAEPAEGDGAYLIVTNPSATDTASIEVDGLGGGTRAPLAGLGTIDLAPGARQVIDLSGVADFGALSVDVRATAPVVVESRLVFGATGDFTDSLGIPVSDAVVVPPVDVVLGPDEVPTETVPPGDEDTLPEGETLPPFVTVGPDGTAPGSSDTGAGG